LRYFIIISEGKWRRRRHRYGDCSVDRWTGGVQGLSGRGRPSHHRRRPTGRRLARKKRGIWGPAEKRAPSPNGSTHARRPISIATYITVAACAACRTAAPPRTTDYYYYRRRRSPDNRRRTRAPTCPAGNRRAPSTTVAQTRARAYTAAAAKRTRAKGSVRPANALQSLDYAQLFRVSSESEPLSEHSSSRAPLQLPPPRT